MLLGIVRRTTDLSFFQRSANQQNLVATEGGLERRGIPLLNSSRRAVKHLSVHVPRAKFGSPGKHRANLNHQVLQQPRDTVGLGDEEVELVIDVEALELA